MIILLQAFDVFRRYTRRTTSNTDSSGIGFIHLRLLRKTPFLTTGAQRVRKAEIDRIAASGVPLACCPH